MVVGGSEGQDTRVNELAFSGILHPTSRALWFRTKFLQM